jgi:hypothetical protein
MPKAHRPPPATDHSESAVFLVVHRFMKTDRRLHNLARRDCSDRAMDAALLDWHAWLAAVIAQPATTLPAVQAKAACLRPALQSLLGDYEEDVATSPELRLAVSLAREIVRLEA